MGTKIRAVLLSVLCACGEQGAAVEKPPEAPACKRPPCPSRHARQRRPDPRAVVGTAPADMGPAGDGG